MITKMENAMIKSGTALYEQQGKDQDQIDAFTDKISKSLDPQKNVGVGQTIQGFVISIILVFVAALIFASFFKKEAPLFATTADAAEVDVKPNPERLTE